MNIWWFSVFDMAINLPQYLYITLNISIFKGGLWSTLFNYTHFIFIFFYGVSQYDGREKGERWLYRSRLHETLCQQQRRHIVILNDLYMDLTLSCLCVFGVFMIQWRQWFKSCPDCAWNTHREVQNCKVFRTFAQKYCWPHPLLLLLLNWFMTWQEM